MSIIFHAVTGVFKRALVCWANGKTRRLFVQLRRDEAGSQLVMITLLMPAMIGIAALSVDGAMWGLGHLNLQGAADSGAVSAARVYSDDASASISLEANAIAYQYGFTNGVNGTEVYAYHPPQTTSSCSLASNDPYIGNQYAFEVIVIQPQNPVFSTIFGQKPANVCGRAVATLTGGDCILALNPSGTDINIGSTGNGKPGNNVSVNMSGCGIFSDSSSSSSIALNANNDTIALTGLGANVGTVGGVSEGQHGDSISPAPLTDQQTVTDPYAAEAATWPSLCSGSACATQTNCTPAQGNNTNPCTSPLSPGVYPNGITFGTNNQSYTMNPGVYYLGSNLTFSGNSVTLNGTGGVTIVLTGNSEVNITGQTAILNITAPTSGWSAGIALWEPTSTNGIVVGSSINNAVENITGVIYMPNASVTYEGNNGGTPACTQIIASTVNLVGNNVGFQGDCNIAGMIQFNQTPVLVE